ncbi:MAG: hypothetical protein AAFU79_28100, partial [Myxococcota bacterium]
GLYKWLSGVLPAGERNDAVLRSAGYDVTRMRRETQTAQDDVQALIALLKEQVELLKTQVSMLQEDRERATDPDAEAAARAVTGGDTVLTTERSADTPQGVAPAGSLRLTDLDPTLTARVR